MNIKPSNNNGLDTNSINVRDYVELFPETDEVIINSMDVTNKIYAIRQFEKYIAQLEVQDKESRAFYAEKTKRCQERIDYIKRNILGYLHNQGLKNISTPAGTAYQKQVTSKCWPSDDVVLAFAQAKCPDAIRTKLEPDKKLLSSYIQNTGQVPEGYTESSEVRLYLK